MDCKLTIFTPVYNRAYCIHRCYNSLVKQENKNFVWIIVDDGSTDNLEIIVNRWIREGNDFRIEYYKKDNGGMYTAYNLALLHTVTDYWMCVDSDDWLSDDAVSIIYDMIKKREESKINSVGFIGLDATPDGNICGGFFPDITQVGLMELKFKYKHKGDVKVIYSTEMSRPFLPMPEIKGEKDFNPYYIMLQMDRTAPLIVINKVLCIVDYQDDGMSARILQSYQESPVSFCMLRIQYLQMPHLPHWFRYKQYIHYVSSWLFVKEQKKHFKSLPISFSLVAAIFPGLLLHFYIRIRNHFKNSAVRR